MQVAAPVVTFQVLGHEKTPTRKTDAWGTLVGYSLWNCKGGMLPRCGMRNKEPNPMTGPPVLSLLGGPGDPQGPGGGSIDAARKLVQKVLDRNNDCSKFFNGATMVELSAMFGGFSTAGQFFNSDKILYDTGTPPVLPPTATAGAYEGAGAGATIWIKPGGLFDKAPNNGADTIGGYLGGTLGAQAEALLHELAHTLSLIPGDSKDPLQSWANEGIIDKNCYYAILASMNAK